MADESDPTIIREEMRLRRAAISEKLEALEHKIVNTVQDTRQTVTDTVRDAKEAVAETVQTVKDAVHSSVDAVKQTLDIKRQVERHPWTMVGGSVAVGYIAGCLLERAVPRRIAPSPVAFSPSNACVRPPAAGLPATQPTQESAVRQDPSWTDELAQKFAPEIKKLKGLAVGVLFGIVRDAVTKSVSPAMSPQIGQLIDSIAAKTGAEPIPNDVLEQLFPSNTESPNGNQRAPQEAWPR
jgi:ElaB/YqjD/DUF883 family membrane-anchored ribosome-binding protein